jgi:hypothetical protein
MTIHRIALTIAFTVAFAGAASKSSAADPKSSGKEFLSQLSLEVTALQTLHRFQMTEEQMKTLRRLVPESSGKAETRQAGTGSDALRKTLTDLRTALIKGDDERIEDLEEDLADLYDKDENELDDDLTISAAARKRAPEALHLMRPAQVAAFLGYAAEEIPDPLEDLLSSLEVAGGLKDAEWKELTEEIVEDLRWQLGGLDPERGRFVAEKVEQFLKKVRSLSPKELERQKPQLEKSARMFVNQIPPTAILHNFAEHKLAELLANPRLAAALDARLEK